MEAKDVQSLQEAYASMYNTSEESQTEVISETVVRTGPDGKPVFPHNEGGPTEAEVRRDMRAGKKPAPSTRAGMKPAKPAPSTRAGKQMKEEFELMKNNNRVQIANFALKLVRK